MAFPSHETTYVLSPWNQTKQEYTVYVIRITKSLHLLCLLVRQKIFSHVSLQCRSKSYVSCCQLVVVIKTSEIGSQLLVLAGADTALVKAYPQVT